MSPSDLVGLQEIAAMASVTASAVANWRRRFVDFPVPIVELKSGPVFSQREVSAWLAARGNKELGASVQFFEQLAGKRGDDGSLVEKIEETVYNLQEQSTSTKRPGVLLGKIQSGKTRAYLGIIARAFDQGYDAAVVLTKGTRSLARQTLSRIKEDFAEFIEGDRLQVYDIMSLPALTAYELNQKLVFVVKKEDDNMRRLLEAFEETYPALRSKRLLIIDDEADLASVSFRTRDGEKRPGVIAKQIDQLRTLAADADYLQVTATPYSLYLQPEGEVDLGGNEPFTPKRPQFTVVLPTHAEYVGGDYYFDRSTDEDSPAYYFYREVPVEERETLKKEDRRRLKIENVLGEGRAAVLRDAMVGFVVGGSTRRLQAKAARQRPEKYSFLFHTEQGKGSHEWQERLATAISEALVEEARNDTPRFNELITRAYSDLSRSVKLAGTTMPPLAAVKAEVVDALLGGQIMITRVNSDKEIEELLDNNGQLKLRTPYNMFIGGQILDRGITISNLIGFYYGRNPKRFQQDTVLQHSRMYGVRPMADLAVTRFYAPQHVYQAMRKIHASDVALREAFESGAHDRGVYFIQQDPSGRIRACSPNKLALSKVVSIRPGRRMVPIGFQTVSRTRGQKSLQELDRGVSRLEKGTQGEMVLVDVKAAVGLLDLAYRNLEFEENGDDERTAHIAALEHLSRMCRNEKLKGKVWLLPVSDRNVRRYREEGRFSDAPDTKQQADAARAKATDLPVLMLLRQNGKEEHGWRGLPFWWPVVVTPRNAVTSIFADKDAVLD